MLANFQHLNLPFQEFYVLERQILLLHNFDSNLLLTLFVDASFNETVLAFSERLLNIVKVMEVREPNSFLNFADPLVSLFPGFKVVDSPLVWEDEHERVEHGAIIECLFHFALDENTGQTLHIFVPLVALVLVRVKLLAEQDVPILPQRPTLLLLLDNFTFDVDRVLALTLVAGFLARCHRKTTNAVGTDTTVRSWRQLVHNASTCAGSDRVQIRIVSCIFEAVISQAVSGTWRQWLLESEETAGTHHARWLNELLLLLNIVALEVRDRDLVTRELLVHHNIVIIVLTRLRHLLAEAGIQGHDLRGRLLHLLDLLDFLDLLLHRILGNLNGQPILLLLLQHLDPLQLLLELCSLEVDVLLKYFLVLVNLVNYILLVFYLLLGCRVLWLIGVIWHLVHTHGSIADSYRIIAQETLITTKAWLAICLPATVRGESPDMAHFRGSDPFHGRGVGDHGFSVGASGSHGLLVDTRFRTLVLAQLQVLHVEVIVPLVAPKVLRAWQSLPK